MNIIYIHVCMYVYNTFKCVVKWQWMTDEVCMWMKASLIIHKDLGGQECSTKIQPTLSSRLRSHHVREWPWAPNICPCETEVQDWGPSWRSGVGNRRGPIQIEGPCEPKRAKAKHGRALFNASGWESTKPKDLASRITNRLLNPRDTLHT